MPVFDGLDYSDPDSLAALGMIAGLGHAAAPSRMPVPFGMAMGDMVAGQAEGMKAAQALRMQRAQTGRENIGASSDLLNLNLFRDFLGMPQLTMQDINGTKPARNSGTPSGGAATGEAVDETSGRPGTPTAGNGAQPLIPGGGANQFATADGSKTLMPAAGWPSSPQASAPAPVPGGVTGPISDSVKKQVIMHRLFGVPFTDYAAAKMYADGLPPGADKDQANQAAAKIAGVNVSPDIRPGGAQLLWDPNASGGAGGYKTVFKNPNLPTGADFTENPDGTKTITMLPGATGAISSSEAAKTGGEEAGKAPFELVPVHDTAGNTYEVFKSSLLGGKGAASGAPPVPPGAAASVGTQGPQAAAAAPLAQPAGTPPPNGAQTPVQMAQKEPVLADVIGPNYQPPGTAGSLPPGAVARGEQGPGFHEQVKDGGERLDTYQKEAAAGQKIYTNLQQMYEVLQRGQNTGNLTEAATSLTNIAQQMGFSNLIPKGFDPNDAAEFNKLSTDLVFAALKQIGGRPMVTEIQGLQKANASLPLPPAANVSILTNVLANQRWMDTRAKLATEFYAQYPASLGDFDAKFNRTYPEMDVFNNLRDTVQKAGWRLPGEEMGNTGFDPSKLPPEVQTKAADIKEKVKGGAMSPQDGEAALIKLGFPD